VIVLDASVVVDLLVAATGTEHIAARLRADGSLHAPALLDLEVAQVLRRLSASRQISPERGKRTVADLADLPVRRYPHVPLLGRIEQLWGRLTAYDAAYVALAEALDATLVTRDRALARVRGHRVTVEVV
jgi:predicted nucleic acid-binding protein